MESKILSPQRTELAKQLRRDGIEKFAHRKFTPREDGISNTLTSVQKDNLLIESDQVIGSMQAHAYRGPTNGPAPCINAAAGMGGGHVPMVTENNDNRGGVFWKGKTIKNGDGLYLGTSPGFFRGGLSEISRTLKAESHDCGVVSDYRIRKLTPRECFRLMDVSDEDIDKIQASGLSNNAQYELAGNSIVVNCLYLIFRNMFIPDFMAEPKAPPVKQPSLFDDFDFI